MTSAPEHHAPQSTSPASARPLDPLFSPRSIAVVGASPNPGKIGHVLMRNLAGFSGPVYPVHPTASEVLGHPAHGTVATIPDRVDLALLAIPPNAVIAAMNDCAAAGVGAAVIHSGGWAEAGEDGVAAQTKLREIARAHGIRLLGPNTSGFLIPGHGIYATFVADLPQTVHPGSLAIVAQSGGVNLSLCFQAQNEGLGVRLGVGLGNAADVGWRDVLEWLAEDDETTVVALAIEGVADGRGLVAAIERLVDRRPVVALTVGRTDVAAFAKSHTGVLTGSYRVKRAALAQAGAVVVDDLTELLDAAQALGATRLPARANAGVGVVTAQAGPGLLLTDALASRGLRIPPLTAEVQERLKSLLPPLTYQENPVDTGRPTETFPKVLQAVSESPGIDILAVSLLHEPEAVDPVSALKNCGPVVLCSQGPQAVMADLREKLCPAGVPLLPTPARAATAVAALVADARHRWLRQTNVTPTHPRSSSSFRPATGSWDEHSAKCLLEEIGVRSPKRVVCATRAEAYVAFGRMGGPLAVKVLCSGIAHKSEIGGVHLNVRSREDLDTALDAIDRIPDARYLIEHMVAAGPELLIGVRRDDAFSAIVLLGSGGVEAEVEDDVTIRLAPVGSAETRAMLGELTSVRRYRGFRGAPAVNEEELALLLESLGWLITTREDIAEIEINPLRVTLNGLYALDAVVVAR